MKKYSMVSESDILRLEKQNSQENYNLDNELSFLEFTSNDKVLDAGCGSGLVTRAMAREFSAKNLIFEACDYSDVTVANAKKYFSKENLDVRTFKSSIDAIASDSSVYDKVVCRYVFEHLENPVDAAKEFFRVLKPGGTAYVIDVDGVVFNFYSENVQLNTYLKTIEANVKFDLYVGRKLPMIMKKAGFSDIKWHAETMPFNTEDELKLELGNYESRLSLAKEVITQALGSEESYRHFKELYLSELAKPENVLFYTKFSVSGVVKK